MNPYTEYIEAAKAWRTEEDRLIRAGTWEDLIAHRATPRPIQPPPPDGASRVIVGWAPERSSDRCAWKTFRDTDDLRVFWSLSTLDGVMWSALVCCHGAGARVTSEHVSDTDPGRAVVDAWRKAQQRADAVVKMLAGRPVGW